MTPREQAIEFFNQAQDLVKADQTMAYRLLSSAVTIDPKFSQGWFALGNANADMKLLPSAIAAFRRALEEPDTDEPGGMTPEVRHKAMVNLGHRCYHAGNLEEARKWTQAAMEAAPNTAFPYTNMSLILCVEGKHEEAIAYARKGFEIDKSPVIQCALAFALMYAGQYEEGLRHFEARIAYRLSDMARFPYPRWGGRPLKGTLLVVAEQGSGDALSYLRFIPALSSLAAKVIVSIQPELVRLARSMCADYLNVQFEPHPVPFPIAEAWTPIGSMPTALGLTTEEFISTPNLPMPKISMPEATWKASGRKLHVGIAWAGSKLNDTDVWRSIPFNVFLELCQVPDVQLYSLQIGAEANDLHNAGAVGLVRDLSPMIRDATDTVCLMSELDLVICCESFVGHLAGAAGRECWIPVAYYAGDYRIGRKGDKSIWYPDHRIFRQGSDADWRPVFGKIVEALKDRVGR